MFLALLPTQGVRGYTHQSVVRGNCRVNQGLPTDPFREAINVMGHTDNGNHPLRRLARLFWASLVICVLGSVIVDVDHLLHWLLGIGGDGRFLHPYFAIFGGLTLLIGIGYLVAYFRRLYRARFLEKMKTRDYKKQLFL